MKVAVPWSLTHYIPLNGYHPLYRALFDFAPPEIELHAWDNVQLQRYLEKNGVVCARLSGQIKKAAKSDSLESGSTGRAYGDFFSSSNNVFTQILQGDIEFHHTAPFPSLKRPFIFHCEAFSPVFLPLAQQGSGKFENHAELKAHYQSIFANPLCLAIFSHLPETLRSFEQFFDNHEISNKLRLSGMGLSEKSLIGLNNCEKMTGSIPRFLFINSAHQNPANFFNRGGHIALMFWQKFRAEGRRGRLVLRCDKPSAALLKKHGVDTDFVESEIGKSILWAKGYLENHEMNALMEASDFLLLPSASLHSASILQAMSAGAIPVVTDTVGTSLYVTDGENGIVLKGMRDAIWVQDEDTGLIVDRYDRMTSSLDNLLVGQLWTRISDLLNHPDALSRLRHQMQSRVKSEFSGAKFAEQFWGDVRSIAEGQDFKVNDLDSWVSDIQKCVLKKEDWTRVFESVPRPVRRVFTGDGIILELGGSFVHARGNPSLRLEDFSALQYYMNPVSPRLAWDYSLDTLVEKLLQHDSYEEGYGKSAIRAWVSQKLLPYPELHSRVNRRFIQAVRLRRSLRLSLNRAAAYRKRRAQKSDLLEDTELVAQDIDGFNVIRHYHLFIAIPCADGAFDMERVRRGGYSVSMTSYSLEGATRKILRRSLHNRGRWTLLLHRTAKRVKSPIIRRVLKSMGKYFLKI